MRLFELSNTFYPYEKSSKHQYGDDVYEFLSSNGLKYVVIFQIYSQTTIGIEFELVENTITYSRSKVGISGTGDQFKILATIKNIIEHHLASIDLSKIDQILFTSDPNESSRVKVYDKFVPIMLKILGPNWKFDYESRNTSYDDFKKNDDVEYIFNNINYGNK